MPIKVGFNLFKIGSNKKGFIVIGKPVDFSDLDNLSKKQIRELRKNADNVLLDGMNNAEPDVPAWKIKACYSIVRLLGGVCIRNRSYRERHGW